MNSIVFPTSDLLLKLMKNEVGILVLCGGKSSRMGVDKFSLTFLGETFLHRIIKTAARMECPVTLSIEHGSEAIFREKFERTLGEIAGTVRIGFVEDAVEDLGPLSGIASGLQSISSVARYAFVTGCDVPDIHPEVVRLLYERILESGVQAVTPREGNRIFGVSAIYETSLWPTARQLVASGRLRVSELAKCVTSETIAMDEFRAVEPDLRTFVNINTPEDYRDLLARYDSPIPIELERKLFGD